ncbi:phosphoribosylanthranilate isomerase [Halarcobacter sp.]|uniref:phosphoribosylanthranilate isomerase n=1 Tax=Halarcobacter sp. TaxID=2321133 RepID=UPI003AFFB37B
MLVKICGMTSQEDIDICRDNGVDIVGFLLQPPSNKLDRVDMLEMNVAKELIEYVPKSMNSCLLIHFKDVEKVISTITALNPDMIQIQKQSTLNLNDLKNIKENFPDIKIIKTFNIEKEVNLEELLKTIKVYTDSQVIDFILVDSEKGGSGKTHDWKQSSEIVSRVKPFPVMLAGGLTPENIKDAISKVNPSGIDVMSGVNQNNSKSKDGTKVSLFVKNVKS